jgi:hypothetical protein
MPGTRDRNASLDSGTAVSVISCVQAEFLDLASGMRVARVTRNMGVVVVDVLWQEGKVTRCN